MNKGHRQHFLLYLSSKVSKFLINVEWDRLENDFDHVTIGYGEDKKVIPVIAGQNGEWKDSLKKLYPEDKVGIDKFFDLVEQTKDFETLGGLLKFLPLWASWLIAKTGLLKLVTNYWSGPMKNTTWDIVTSLIKNKDLQTVLTYCWGDYGSPPHESHFVMQVIFFDMIQIDNN